MLRVIFLLLMFLPGSRDRHTRDVSHTTSSEPKRADLVGTYVPDEATRELILNVGGYPPRTTSIELDADGTIRITNIPDWWNLPADVHRTGFDSGNGTWTLHHHRGHWHLKLDFPSMKDFDSDRWQASAVNRPQDHPDVGLSTGVLLVGEHPPYIIEIVIRRRGVNEVMRFTKVETAGDRQSPRVNRVEPGDLAEGGRDSGSS